ncbi:hypothetical protein [Winogradskyella sp. 3972H.M.0a.05]|uniref:hypothetical protein n=1 Tax=Winogradskyella sp. 3972H.M.0a.05 TaxID=2950277 RepID=UPI0033941C8A
MRFENSPYQKSLSSQKKVLDFADLYLCDDFFIMEVNEGIHFDREKLDDLLDSLRNHYGNHKRLAYIANRVNSYSIEPILWSYFDEDDSILFAASIVSYRDSTYMSANIEKKMAAISIKRSDSLERAIDWVQNLKELN